MTAPAGTELTYESAMAQLGKAVRPGQQALVELGLGLEPGQQVLVNAPTATGKSLAALIISGVRARDGQRCVISTFTKLLQDQYKLQDLVQAQQIFPDVDFAVFKGAANYLCRKAADGIRTGDYPALAAGDGDPGEVGTGGLWRARADAVRCRRHSVEDCGYAAAKARARAADVVITNHALVLINGMQPQVLGTHDLLIVDEVHNLARAAESLCTEVLDIGDFLTENYRLFNRSADYGLRALAAAVRPGVAERFMSADEVRQVIAAYRMLPAGAQGGVLKDWISAAVARTRGTGSGRVATVAPRGDNTQWPKQQLLLHTVDLAEVCAAGLKTEWDVPVSEDTCGCGHAEEEHYGAGCIVCGCEAYAARSERAARAVLLMSATTGTPERPTWVAGRAGVREIELVKVPSPLRYKESLRVSVVAPAGKRWSETVPALVKEVGGRTLVLMRSWARVEQIAEALAAAGFRVHVQNRKDPAENAAVVRRFREETESVLVGTASFFEGIDVPGESLSQVIIGDLPFPLVHGLVARERQRLEGAGYRAEVSVPGCAVVLEQMIGRLIRAVGDRGLIAVLDGGALRGDGAAALRAALDTFGGREVLVPRAAALDWYRQGATMST